MKYIHYLSSFLKHVYILAALGIALLFALDEGSYHSAMYTVAKAQALAVIGYVGKMNGG